MPLKLTILGSSGALPAYGRFPSAQHLSLQDQHFLIDCGEGTQMQLAKHNLGVHRLQRIFISHLHGDHYLGLMGLIFSMHLQKREAPLHLHAFSGLDEIIIAQLRHSRSVLNFPLIFHPLKEGVHEVIATDDLWSVEAIPLRHKIPTCGFIFREKPGPRRMDKSKLPKGMAIAHIAQLRSGKDVYAEDGSLLYRYEDYTLPPRSVCSYAYCSDSQPSPEYTSLIGRVHLLYHEATFMEADKDKARLTLHSTAAEAATVAKEARVGKLLLGHFSARYRDLAPVLAEAKAIFDMTDLAIEGNTYELN